MTDVDIPSDPGSHLNDSSQSYIEALEPFPDMVMTRSKSREMEADITTTTGVPASTATTAENVAAVSYTHLTLPTILLV